ncbi:hypothetical protein [Micromonospora carbonacea]|uniref:hypothetical protein n=1 Tax=Micromonospora carbonacea TaxID=47853 RepID=UPI003715E635
MTSILDRMTGDAWPVVVADPRRNFGHPSVGAISTEAVAGMVMAGEPMAAVCEDYGLTRHQVLLACWHEGLQGQYRRQWKAWATEAHQMLGGWVKPFDLAAIPDPPSRADLGETARP